MDYFSTLPIELIIIIISDVGECNTHGKTCILPEQILPLAATSKLFCQTAKPYLYEQVNLSFYPQPKGLAEFRRSTRLICRSFRENPSLASYIRDLSINGFPANDNATFGTETNSQEISDFLVQCTNVRKLAVHAVPVTQDPTYQLILSAIQRMPLLESFNLRMDPSSEFDVVSNYFAVISTNLKKFSIQPSTQPSTQGSAGIFSGLQNIKAPTTTPRFHLRKLTLAAPQLPIALLDPWIHNLSTLNLHRLIFSSDRLTNLGVDLEDLLKRLTSTLQKLTLSFHQESDPLPISNLNMSQMVVLHDFAYQGPWCFNEHVNPTQLCHSLFSRQYNTMSLDFSTNNEKQQISLKSIEALGEAFSIAVAENLTPKRLEFVADVSDSDIYDVGGDEKIKQELKKHLRMLRNHGVNASLEVILIETCDEYIPEYENHLDESD